MIGEATMSLFCAAAAAAMIIIAPDAAMIRNGFNTMILL